MGSLAGNLINDGKANAYANNCENLTCASDLLGGFRCFDTGFDGYNCDDSGYPSCSEVACGGAVVPIDPIGEGN